MLDFGDVLLIVLLVLVCCCLMCSVVFVVVVRRCLVVFLVVVVVCGYVWCCLVTMLRWVGVVLLVFGVAVMSASLWFCFAVWFVLIVVVWFVVVLVGFYVAWLLFGVLGAVIVCLLCLVT